MKIYLRRTIEEYWTLDVDEQLVEKLKATEPTLQGLADDEIAARVFKQYSRKVRAFHAGSTYRLRQVELKRDWIEKIGAEEIGIVVEEPLSSDEDAISKEDAVPERLWELDPDFGAEDSIMISIDPSDK
jgi:hypothetical protein